jgi:hypothetical protein
MAAPMAAVEGAHRGVLAGPASISSMTARRQRRADLRRFTMIREGIKEGINDVSAPCEEVHTRSSRCRYNNCLPLTTLVRGVIVVSLPLLMVANG